MFILKAASKVFSDCTCHYDVELDRNYTVSEFIKTILTNKPNEWGYIGLRNRDNRVRCYYIGGKVIDDFPQELMNRNVRSVKASGGCTRMDYVLDIGEID